MSLRRRQVLGSTAAAVLGSVGAAGRGPDYGAVAYPAHAGDVALCMDFARRAALPVAARGGGHGYAGWSTRADGLVIDVGAMAAVAVEGDGVRIGAGARLGDVNAALAGQGLAVPTGLCPSVGIAELHWPDGDSAAVLRGWQRWLETLPDPFRSQVEFTVEAGSTAPPPPPAVRVVCLDGRPGLDRQLTRLSDLVGRPERDGWSVVRSYGDTVRALSGCLERSTEQCRLPGTLPGRDPRGLLGRHSYAARSDFWAGAGLPDAAIDAVLAAVRRYGSAVPPVGVGVVQFDGVCGGALNRVAAADTAFVHRDSAFLAQYLAYWPPSAAAAEVARHQAWLDGLWQDLRPWASGRAYQNYSDPRLAGWREAYYGPNLSRLEDVRRAYDPDRLFRFPQAV